MSENRQHTSSLKRCRVAAAAPHEAIVATDREAQTQRGRGRAEEWDGFVGRREVALT